jgi:hypothetical protein
MNIGEATNSPIQQAGAGATLSQNITYNQEQIDDLKKLVELFTQSSDELGLDPKNKQRAKAQVETIKAQLDEPHPTIVQQALKTLKRIGEGAAGDFVGGVMQQPIIWIQIMAIVDRFLSDNG